MFCLLHSTVYIETLAPPLVKWASPISGWLACAVHAFPAHVRLSAMTLDVSDIYRERMLYTWYYGSRGCGQSRELGDDCPFCPESEPQTKGLCNRLPHTTPWKLGHCDLLSPKYRSHAVRSFAFKHHVAPAWAPAQFLGQVARLLKSWLSCFIKVSEYKH